MKYIALVLLVFLLLSVSAFAQFTSYPSPLVGPTGPTGATGTVSATTFVQGLPLAGATFPVVRAYAAASGDVDLFTSPANKRTLISAAGVSNNTLGTINWYAELKSGGNYYRLTTSAALLTHAFAASSAIGIILEAGESISVHTDAIGLNIQIAAIQFANTSPLRTVKLLGAATGDNTLYTVPANKTASVLGVTMLAPANTSSIVYWVSDAGGSRLVLVCPTVSGDATACTAFGANMLGFFSVGASTRLASASASMSLATGDFILVDVDTGAATQIAWVNVLEF